MRIGVVGCRGYPSYYGGFETFVRHLAPGLVDYGHEVVVYGHGGLRPRRVRAREGLEAHFTIGASGKAAATLSHGLTGVVAAQRDNLDVALVLNVANGYFLPGLRLAGLPSVVNVDGIEWQRGKWGPIARRVFRGGAWLSARYATRLVADSAAIATVWRSDFGREPVYIPYGASVPVQAPGRRGVEQLSIQRPYALVVARLVPENNVEVIVDAYSALDPSVLDLVVVGSANFDYDLVDRLARLRNAGSIHWLGHVSDQELLKELWAHCSVYLHGHSVGGTNPALLEALACGAPTMALDTAFNAEVVGEGHSALFRANVEDISKRLAAVASGDLRYVVRSEDGQRIIRERFEWPSIVAAYEQLLREAADDRH